MASTHPPRLMVRKEKKKKGHPSKIPKSHPTAPPNTSPRHHCLNRALLSPPEMKWLIDANVQLQFKREVENHPRIAWPRQIDWDAMTAQFNARFGTPHRTEKEILCVVNGGHHDFWHRFIRRYWHLIQTKNYPKRK